MAPNSRSQTLPENSLKPDSKSSTAEEKLPSSLPGFRLFPDFHNLPHVDKCYENWLVTKRENDDIGSLWRVNDKLYDVTSFIKSHPGGTVWLERSRGTDITELFETSHFGKLPAKILEDYYVRDATTPRYSPFTFEPNGFYKTLKGKITPIIEEHGTGPSSKMNRVQDGLISSTIVLGMLGAYFHSYFFLLLSGIALSMLTYCTHNYLHQKDNLRMYWFDLSFLSHDEWRVTHVMSHHVFPNSNYDWEVAVFEPHLSFYAKDKPWYQVWPVLVTFHIVTAGVFYYELLRRVVMSIKGKQQLRWFNAIPFIGLMLPMIAVSDDVILAIVYFFVVQLIGSYSFILIGLTIGHHHPENFHDGDASRLDRDWGLCQLDCIHDRNEFSENLFLTSSFLGDHSLHHLFPTLDHSKLPLLYPAFLETCKEFGYDYGTISQWEASKGCFQMLLKTVGRDAGHDVKSKKRF